MRRTRRSLTEARQRLPGDTKTAESRTPRCSWEARSPAAGLIEAFARNSPQGLGKPPGPGGLDVLRRNPGAIPVVFRHGPEAVGTLARYGDEGVALVGQYGDDMLDFLRRTPDEAGDLARRATEALDAARRLKEVGLHSDEAAGLIDTILDASVHGSGDRVVIGTFRPPTGGPGYIDEALENGGVYFNTPPGLYRDALAGNRQIMEEVNREFLRGQMRAGVDRIELVGESIRQVLTKRADSFTAVELRLLMDEASRFGYRLQEGVWVRGASTP